jgi:hypothetical protein
MQKPHRAIRTFNRIGDPSSKYGYDRTGEQFERDIRANKERAEVLWNDFLGFMKSHEVDPVDFRLLFARYYEEFLEERK